MTFGELKQRALVSADEVGNDVEYKDQLIEATNKVLNKLVVFARSRIKYSSIASENKIITLPNDCYELIGVRDNNLSNVIYDKIDNNEIRVAADGTYDVKYKAFLPNVTSNTQDSCVIDIEPIEESCVVTGVASWIAVDNPELYDVLNGEYNNLLSNLSQIPEPIDENSNGIIGRVAGWYW